jgi:hypothetical protein
MKTTELNPNQIITLNDYPVYSKKDLRDYFKKCQLKKELPLVPVMRKNIVRKHLDSKLIRKLEKFEEKNPDAKYFMLDGTHRTTALTLAGCQITVIVYDKDEDIIEAKKLVAKGKIVENATLRYSLIENCKILNKHFNLKPYFMTVEQKTKKMVKERIIPKYMIDTYQKKI